ncbi:DUF1345 domain-containing protein [Ferruginibacter sp. HRS2-29]|uniref:DUF1345 domain-containing protein n=1 Tax=Ferruginibacter sp. HRS2-29 TaxID=2487334 RepID=UPI0020CE63FC|nr:DUF1345 domain-containing protein [Ferruginibacter sp. HRS2-29]
MPRKKTKEQNGNLILRMYPLERFIISLAVAGLAVFFAYSSDNALFICMIGWIGFSASFLLMSWIIFFKRSVGDIKNIASGEDGNKFFVTIMVLFSSFAGMFTILLLMLSKDSAQAYFLPVAITGMLLSWAMVHTVFTFHYAHMYYDVPDKGGKKIAGGLEFPGDEKEPDYIDFAYFSFVIGCTFQVSDVEISSRKIRRLVLLHGLLSFGLNTFVVALTINIVAGLKN